MRGGGLTNPVAQVTRLSPTIDQMANKSQYNFCQKITYKCRLYKGDISRYNDLY